MTLSARPLAVLAAAAALSAVACSSPRTPQSAEPGDAGELTCDERVRARATCIDALRSRCQAEQSDCENACESRGALPGNTQKVPSERDDLGNAQCHERCRLANDACQRAAPSRCPSPC